MSLSEEIKRTIRDVLSDATIYVADPDGEHFQAIVISPSFVGMPLVKQHQVVMKALKSQFESTVHALALKTFTPEKWAVEEKNYPGIKERL